MIPRNKQLYACVKGEADKKFLAPTSAYKSAWIVREYKKRGGIFRDKPNPNEGLLRWFKEKWVNINRPGEACGREKASVKGTYPLCRPSVFVTKDTPTLKQELSKKVLVVANKEKQKLKNKGRLTKI